MLSGLIPVAYLIGASVCFYVALNVPTDRRWLCMPFLCCSAGLSLSTAHHISWPQGFSDLWRVAAVIWTLHAVSILFIEEGIDNHLAPGLAVPWDLRAAYKLLFNFRLLNSGRMSEATTTRTQNVSTFAAKQLTKLLAIWLLHTQVEPWVYPGPFLPFKSADFDPTRQVFFRRLLLGTEPSVTLREVVLRACFAVRWIWVAVYEIETAHAFFALLFVALLRIDTPEEWPPLFGSPSETYNLRRFWGRFWHRIAYRPYTNFAKLASRRLLGLKASSGGDKVVRVLVVFLISGLVHSFVSRCSGDKDLYILDAYFFVLNFFGGALELAFTKLLNLSIGKELQEKSWSTKRQSKVAVWKMGIGFLWVFGFFFWAVPKWQYPRAYQQLQYVERVSGLMNIFYKAGESTTV